MREIFIAVMACLLLSSAAHAQSKVAPSTSNGAEVQSKPEASAQSAELDEANRLTASAVKLYSEGKYDEALPAAKRALEIREKVLEPDHQLVASALFNLAAIYLATGKYRESESLYQRLLAIDEKKLGPDDAKVAQVLGNLALLRFARGDNAKAEEYYRRALSIREKTNGQESQEVAQSLVNLAEFYQATGSYTKAEPLYQRALAIREKALGPSHPKVSDTLERYACLERKLKNRAEAEALERRAAGGSPLGLPGKIGQGVKSDDTPSLEAGLLNGRALSLPKPPYPPEAKEMRATGLVKVVVTIDEAGKVVHACAVEGPSVFWQVTESAAAHARFSPTLLSGQPVKVTAVITYRFEAR